MSDTVQDQLILDLSRDLVAQLAPQELPLFRAQSAAFLRDPDKALAPARGRDDELGFGVAEAVVFITPYVLAVMGHVVPFVAALAAKAAQQQGAVVIDGAAKRMFRKFSAEAPGTGQADPAPLTAAQLAEVREMALRQARQLRLSEARAALLADAVVGSLAVATQ